MSNHFHVVVRIDAARADSWSTDPEESDFTAVQQRLGREPAAGEEGPGTGEAEGDWDGVEALPRAPLMPFDATGRTEWAIPYAFDDYLELGDWLSRAVHPAKKGRIPPNRPKILARLGMDAEGLAEAGRRGIRLSEMASPSCCRLRCPLLSPLKHPERFRPDPVPNCLRLIQVPYRPLRLQDYRIPPTVRLVGTSPDVRVL